MPSDRSSHELHRHVDPSLGHVTNAIVSFSHASRGRAQRCVARLMRSTCCSARQSVIRLRTSPHLFRLCRFSEGILLRLGTVGTLGQQRSTRTLCAFVRDLPQSPTPVSLTQLHTHLGLGSPMFSRGRAIEQTVRRLHRVKCLSCARVRQKQAGFFYVRCQHPQLGTPGSRDGRGPLRPSPTRGIDPRVTRGLTLLRGLNVALSSLRGLFGSH